MTDKTSELSVAVGKESLHLGWEKIVESSVEDEAVERSQHLQSANSVENSIVSSPTERNGIDDNLTVFRGMPAGCVFVASLSKLLKDSELNASVAQHFSQWGRVLNVKVFRDWMQRPYGFVQFENLEDAQRALEEAAGTMLDGRYIRCEPARVNRTIYLCHMPADTMKKELQELADNFGEVEDITLVKSSSKQPVTVNAFLRYKYREDAVKAYLALYKDPPLHAAVVEWAANVNQSHHKLNNFVHQSSSCTLFVRNLPTTVSQETLHCRFGQFGYVASVTIIGRTLMSKKRLGFNNDSQCCAFVRYLTKVDARKAQASENGSDIHGHTIHVGFKDSNAQINDNTKSSKLRKPHPPGRCLPASMNKAYFPTPHKKMDGSTVKNNNSSAPFATTGPAIEAKRDPQNRVRQANNHYSSSLVPYPTEIQPAQIMHPCTNGGYQVPCNTMTYFSSQANTNDFSGMCYPLPLYHYGMDYGTGYYYNNGYGYPGSCYPVHLFQL